MNINAISSQNFGAQMVEKDYHFGQMLDDLFDQRYVGANEVRDFHDQLKKLPLGDIELDQYIKHGDSYYVFGKIHKPCNRTALFEVKQAQLGQILDEMLNSIKVAFKETCNHVKCPNRFIR